MGTIYSVACRDCLITRDLDKFYALLSSSCSRDEALLLEESIKRRYTFNAALLVSFMATHLGHNCTIFSEHDEELNRELSPYYQRTTEDINYWEQ
jgi:hypothetical protein